MVFLFLSSTNSLQYHPDNTGTDFTVELPHVVHGQYECALSEIFYDNFQDDLYVYSDICEQNVVHNDYKPILRIVTQPGEVQSLYFMPVSRDSVQRIRIYLRDKDFKTPQVSLNTVRCTLVFRAI